MNARRGRFKGHKLRSFLKGLCRDRVGFRVEA